MAIACAGNREAVSFMSSILSGGARLRALESRGRCLRRGEPLGLRGEDIPLESRILLVADAFDAMTSDRAYRAAMPVAEALAELRRCAGRQFDARCVELLGPALGERAGALDHVVELG